MLKTTFAAAVLALAATAASAQDYRAQGWQDRGGPAPYGYDNSSSALGRYCPPGFYPHSYPNGSGIRCESPDQNTHFDKP